MAKALVVHANTIRQPEKTPGIERGSVTRQNTRAGPAPRLSAARSSAGSMCASAAASTRIMVGIEKCTRPISTPAGSNSSRTGQVTRALPSTSIQA